ncbi:MAG: serine hydrolase [Anaerolineae bacterium]|nr:serine hydrolase [Anaerolineae bacterium]
MVKKRLLVLIGIGLLVALLAFVSALCLFDSPRYAWRILAYGQSDTGDIARFPARPIAAASHVSALPVEPASLPETVTFPYRGQSHTESLQTLIQRTGTAAFLVVRDDKIVMQVYHEGETATPHTSFSVAKSFDSALIGAAIADGYIDSVNDPVIHYVPEIAGRGLDDLTIRNLLRMDSGIAYRSEEEGPFFLSPFCDDALTYYGADLREVALRVQAGGSPLGAAFHYNNYHPLLEGLIIERATGMSVAVYLQERIWKPLGAAFPASWSLDSEVSGFEKMESGINAAAVDYARFGLLYLHNGFYNGTQILPRSWIVESTAPDPADTRIWETQPDYLDYGGYYGYHWWGLQNAGGSYDFSALGHLWQLIYVAPRKNVVIVRLGNETDPAVDWSLVARSLVDQLP